MALGLLVGVLQVGCGHDDGLVPAFLHVEDVCIVPPANNAITLDTGFYLSDVRAVYVTARREGSRTVDTLGLFRLPFTAPVLIDGPVERITLSPAVPYSGQADMLPYYTFYNRITRDGITFVPEDTVNLGTLNTTYAVTQSDMLLWDPFEYTEMNICFDSVMQWRKQSADSARAGQGFALLHVDDTLSYTTSHIIYDFAHTDPSKLLYMEFDIRSTTELSICMESYEHSGSTLVEYGVVNVYPCAEWTHMYVNLGRTKSYYNNVSATFRLLFRALNVEGNGGDVMIDNLKILTTGNVL